MSDLLSPAGLLLALVTMLYSLWYGDLEKAITTPVPIHDEDRVAPLRTVHATWRSRAAPLVVATWALAVVLAPDAVSVCVNAAHRVWRDGPGSVAGYDAVKTTYVLVTIGAAFMAVQAFAIARRIRRKLRDLQPAKKAGA
jgi:hypothetical protein